MLYKKLDINKINMQFIQDVQGTYTCYITSTKICMFPLRLIMAFLYQDKLCLQNG